MPVLRINAEGDTPRLHTSPRPVDEALARCGGDGPVAVMIHGYKYQPGSARNCPHLHILALHPRDMPWRAPSWPRQLGFGTGHQDEGLAIAFGWNARGALWRAQRRAVEAGRALAEIVRDVRRRLPGRPVHVLAHSLGIELALEALHHLPPGAIDRIVSMTGASYRSARIDPVKGSFSESTLIDGPAAEFPRVHPGRIGRRTDRTVMLLADPDSGVDHPLFATTAMVDRETGRIDAFVHGPTEIAEEAILVPAEDGDTDSDAGWVLQTVLDYAAARTRLKIFDATDLSSGPVAVATLPYALPAGLHGSFMKA